MSDSKDTPKAKPPIVLEKGAPLGDFQRYIHELESMHGWLDVDLVHNCFLLGEEVGELFKAVRKHEKLWNQTGTTEPDQAERTKAHVGEELVDVFNYLMAIANRLDIDVEEAFRKKNARNQERTWEK